MLCVTLQNELVARADGLGSKPGFAELSAAETKAVPGNFPLEAFLVGGDDLRGKKSAPRAPIPRVPFTAWSSHLRMSSAVVVRQFAEV